MTTNTITGDKRLDRKLRHLAGKAQRKVVRAGIGKGMTILSRGIRNAIPPSQKSAKKTIGRRHKKNKITGQYEAKVGLGVGKQTKSKKQRDPSRPGVGISKANIHWLVLGTKGRHKDTGQRTGRMEKAPDWVKQGVRATEKEAYNAMRDVMRQKVIEEARKA